MLEKSTDELQNVQGHGLDSSIYNGRGWMVWQELKDRPRPSNGQYQISLARLKTLMQAVPVAIPDKAGGLQPIRFAAFCAQDSIFIVLVNLEMVKRPCLFWKTLS